MGMFGGRMLKSHFLIDQGSEFMGSSESSNDSLLFIKYLRKWVVSLSSNASIKHPPHPALFYQNMTLNYLFPYDCDGIAAMKQGS